MDGRREGFLYRRRDMEGKLHLYSYVCLGVLVGKLRAIP
jgi:hypothetical protein